MQVLRVEKVEAGFRETGMLTRIAGMHRANSLFRIRLEVRGGEAMQWGGGAAVVMIRRDIGHA